MNEEAFQTEQDSLLSRMATRPAPDDGRWPDGCYGSHHPWLTFVGPSPGGGDGTAPEIPRQDEGELPLWNQEYTEPCDLWSVGFRVSTQVLVEIILGRYKGQGALKLYSFANFDWMQNPKARNVPTERMRRGSKVLLQHLATVQPRIIVTMERKAHQLLSDLLSEQYFLRPQQFAAVNIFIGDTRRGPRYHRHMEGYEIVGNGPLAGRYVVRCPQHPARILKPEYAGRVARAVRKALCALANQEELISIEER